MLFAGWTESRILFRRRQSEYAVLKEPLRAHIRERLAFFNDHYQFPLRRLAIKNAKSRWGSCSKQGNLNFNYLVAKLPAPLSDYVIVHELCHIKEFNHSPAFWSLVAETVPDFKQKRAALRHYFVK